MVEKQQCTYLLVVTMIKLIQSGVYQLTQTTGESKILTLDKAQIYTWRHSKETDVIWTTFHTAQKSDHLLAMGKYRYYTVEDDFQLTDALHLELLVGEGVWQGYLLSLGFPRSENKHSRIIPTHELVSRSQ